MKKYTILLVDDDIRIINFLKPSLKASGYEIITANNGIQALKSLDLQDPDMIILDLLMQEMDGIATLTEIRKFSTIPIIIVSAKGDDVDRIKGLKLGADDYLSKPFNLEELIARIDAVKRRIDHLERLKTRKTASLGEITIDFEKCVVMISDRQISLTRIERLLLFELVANAGKLLTYEELLIRIWGPEYRNDLQILRMWISRLKKKLAKDTNSPPIIHNLYKAGYILENPDLK